jgi:hypothetical protein
MEFLLLSISCSVLIALGINMDLLFVMKSDISLYQSCVPDSFCNKSNYLDDNISTKSCYGGVFWHYLDIQDRKAVWRSRMKSDAVVSH